LRLFGSDDRSRGVSRDTPEVPKEERMACRISIERRVWAVAVALGLIAAAPAVEAQQVVKIAADPSNRSGGLIRSNSVLTAGRNIFGSVSGVMHGCVLWLR